MEIMKKRSFWIAAAVTLVCSLLGKYTALLPGAKLIGALVLSLLFGMVLQILPSIKQQAADGIGFISNKFLRLGIILLGFRLNLMDLAESGIKTIALAIVVVTFTIVLTYFLCRKLKVSKELAILAACGCGVCGAAAVMGVSPQVKSKKDDAVLAVAVVCILGTLFTLVEIALKPILGMTDVQLGIMNGASLHEIAHAVAAGGANGEIALNIALIMKLSRVLLLAPVAFIVGIWYQKSSSTSQEKQKLPIPWFMAGFLASSIAGSFLPIPVSVINQLVALAYIFLGMAMAALGLSVNFKVISERGGSVLFASFISSTLLLCLVVTASLLFF